MNVLILILLWIQMISSPTISQVLRVSYWGHKISKSTSVDCNKIYIVMVKVRKVVGITQQFPHYSYTVGAYGKGPTGDYTTCTYSS